MSSLSGGTIDTSLPNMNRSVIYSNFMKERVDVRLMNTSFVTILNQFPDGDTFSIPTMGKLVAQRTAEGTPLRFQKVDTGSFTFSIGEAYESSFAISDYAKEDNAWYMGMMIPKLLPEAEIAIMGQFEKDVLSVHKKQTVANPNVIDGRAHRFVATGAGQTVTLKDFADARLALDLVGAPAQGRMAIVDPTVVHTLSTQPNVLNLLTPNMSWGNLITTGISDDMRFAFNLYGFDVYVSNNLSPIVSEAITVPGESSINSGINAVANLFFSTVGDTSPFIGAWRRKPTVEQGRNMALKQDEYTVSARWGMDLYRYETLVTVISSKAV
jgi:hypothetical protein